jgi:hypothetical protein
MEAVHEKMRTSINSNYSILDIGTRWKWVVISFSARPFYPRCPMDKKLGRPKSRYNLLPLPELETRFVTVGTRFRRWRTFCLGISFSSGKERLTFLSWQVTIASSILIRYIYEEQSWQMNSDRNAAES